MAKKMREMFGPFAIIMQILGVFLTLAPDAHLAAKVPQVGVLIYGGARDPRLAAFRRGLRELGYIEGKNIIIEYRFIRGKPERVHHLTRELVRRKVDVIVTGGTLTARAAQRATATIPIVFAFSGDPVGTGLVASLAQPGGNVTGLSMISAELAGKRLELLKEAAPGISSVGVLWDALVPDNILDYETTQRTARALHLRLQSLAVRGPKNGYRRGVGEGFIKGPDDHFRAILSTVAGHRLDALLIAAGGIINRHQKTIIEFATANRLPVMHETLEFAEAGGLMAYGVNLSDLFRRSASYVAKILNGANPADLPVERPMKAEFVVNLKTAQEIALAIPHKVLQRADKVVK